MDDLGQARCTICTLKDHFGFVSLRAASEQRQLIQRLVHGLTEAVPVVAGDDRADEMGPEDGAPNSSPSPLTRAMRRASVESASSNVYFRIGQVADNDREEGLARAPSQKWRCPGSAWGFSRACPHASMQRLVTSSGQGHVCLDAATNHVDAPHRFFLGVAPWHPQEVGDEVECFISAHKGKDGEQDRQAICLKVTRRKRQPLLRPKAKRFNVDILKSNMTGFQKTWVQARVLWWRKPPPIDAVLSLCLPIVALADCCKLRCCPCLHRHFRCLTQL